MTFSLGCPLSDPGEVVGGVPGAAAGAAGGGPAAGVPDQRAGHHQEAHRVRDEHHQGARTVVMVLVSASVAELFYYLLGAGWKGNTLHNMKEMQGSLRFMHCKHIWSACAGAGKGRGGKPVGAAAPSRSLLQRAHQVRTTERHPITLCACQTGSFCTHEQNSLSVSC